MTNRAPDHQRAHRPARPRSLVLQAFTCAGLLCCGAYLVADKTAAAVDPVQRNHGPLGQQLIIVETAHCQYCRVFRKRILPVYAASGRAQTLPIRLLRVDQLKASGIEINAPVDIVPTTLVIENRREVGRIVGYAAQGLFFKAIDHILRRVAPPTMREPF